MTDKEVCELLARGLTGSQPPRFSEHRLESTRHAWLECDYVIVRPLFTVEYTSVASVFHSRQ